MIHYASNKGARAIFLFIAEMNGFKKGKVSEKEAFGLKCYLTGALHDLDADIEDDRKEMHENIWLERLYDDLDIYYQLTDSPVSKKMALAGTKTARNALLSNPLTDHQWSVAIELDASASMLQWIGILLNDKRLLTMTNVIGDTLSDPWDFDLIPRTQFKDGATPRLYGSSKACHELWQAKGHKYTIEQVTAFNKELASGALGIADQFKEFIINNVKPQENMELHIWSEKFRIECNRYKNVGEKTTTYSIYDTQDARIKPVVHTDTKKVPDLEQFRRYFVTALIHNLDSQAEDEIIDKVMEKYNWGMDLHDAFIINPESAEDVRKWYCHKLTEAYNNREQILSSFFASIGIGAEAQGQWEALKSKIVPVIGFKAQEMALK